LTHGHLDHAGGLWAVVEQLEIGQIWFGRSWDERVFLTAAERGIEIVLDPDTALSMNRQSRSDNDRSLVLPIQSGPFSVLLTGDIGAKREASLGSLGRVDVLKVAHHGSATSSSERMLDQLKPAIALISTSGAYGLPHPDVLERYRKRGIVVLRTDTLGTISLRFEDTGLTGWHHRAGEGWQSLDLGELEAAGPG
jgi:competence protein ComEC